MPQFTTFEIGEQTFGIDIMAIREIRAWTPTTALPGVPDYVCGVVNLRGTVLPVIDLRALLGWGNTSPSARHVIVVVRVNDKLHGLIVDAVNDIVSIDEAELQPPPNILGDQTATLILGLAAIDNRMVMVLALDRLSVAMRIDEQVAEAA
ncbi:MAG: chemotaxis protein CheW [Pseudomonadota bacterium]